MTTGKVNSYSEAYNIMEEDWHLPKALMGGEKAMKLAGKIYLPQEPMEDADQYVNRVERSTLKNYFAWAIENHTGRVFNKPIVLSEDTPDVIVEYNKNLDFMGNNTNNFYRAVFRDMMIKGISYIYIDYPRTNEDLSLADEMDAKFRPYCVHIKAEQVINAVPGLVNGRIVLLRAHILEEIEEEDGPWSTKTVEQVRVLYPGYWELYRSEQKTDDLVLIDSGETSLNYIPLVPIYGKNTGFFSGTSPLQNLAYLNRAHWQSLSDQMNITHVGRVPILFGTGFDNEETLTIGAKVSILGPTDSALSYVEHSGKAIQAGMDELKDLEERMLLESLELVGGNGTATGQSLDVSDANCSLQDLALRLQDVITKVNLILCDWEDITREGNALVSTDFGLHLKDGSESNILLKARQNKSISLETFHREMKRRGLLSPDFNSDNDIKLLEAEALTEPQPYANEDGKQVVGDENADNLDNGKPRIE